jgi:Outer membrane efflux protein
LHAASAQIGVAIANLLPNFTINGNIGYMNTTLAGLLAPQNLFWSAAANATQTVLDGGSLFHQKQESKDLYNAAAWSYRGTVIGAVQNVSDALRALQNDSDALRAARDSQRAAKISFDLARQQKWCRRAQRAWPIPPPFSRRSAGIAPLRCPKRPSMWEPAKRDQSSNATTDCSRSSSRISRISALWLGSCRGTIG